MLSTVYVPSLIRVSLARRLISPMLAAFVSTLPPDATLVIWLPPLLRPSLVKDTVLVGSVGSLIVMPLPPTVVLPFLKPSLLIVVSPVFKEPLVPRSTSLFNA